VEIRVFLPFSLPLALFSKRTNARRFRPERSFFSRNPFRTRNFVLPLAWPTARGSEDAIRISRSFFGFSLTRVSGAGKPVG